MNRMEERVDVVVSIEEYRRLLNDHESSDERIWERLRYVESLCRNVIRSELENYMETSLDIRKEEARDSKSQNRVD
jgi:DNA mismatch repair ATPase MutS